MGTLGRRGLRVAVELAESLRLIPGTEAILSLTAEIMRGPSVSGRQVPVRTYNGLGGFLLRLLAAPARAASRAASKRSPRGSARCRVHWIS